MIAWTASRSVPGSEASSAATISLSVLAPRISPRSSSSSRRASVLVRLPLCPSATIPPCRRFRVTGWEFSHLFAPVVE
jgi:hypothetical protein